MPDIIKFSLDETFVLDAASDSGFEEMLPPDEKAKAKARAKEKAGAEEAKAKAKAKAKSTRSSEAKRGRKPKEGTSDDASNAGVAKGRGRGSRSAGRSGSDDRNRPKRVAQSDRPDQSPPESVSRSEVVQPTADQVLGSEKESVQVSANRPAKEAGKRKKKARPKKSIDLLTGLTRDQVRDLRGYGQQTTYEEGDPVYTKGEPSNGTYIVLKGAVDVNLDLWGGLSVDYKAQAGEFFGEEEPGAGLDQRTWSAVARKHTEIFEIPGDAFETFRWMSDSRASMRLLRNSVCILARRLRKRSTRKSSAGARAQNQALDMPERGLVHVLEALLEPSLASEIEHNPYLKHLEISEGGYLYRRGDSPNGFFIVLEGALEVIGKSRAGKAEKSATLASPTAVGEVSNFSKQKRSLSIRALTPVTVIQFRDDIFTEIRRLEPETALDLLYLVARFLGALVAMPKPMLDGRE